ncbi:uncharacterized protein LOC127752184, partial [Frankliniella occidentalis]|uniref:Uncharacterized protein LOC127752184 n=1 Tax=Frankliniella occidentalis TaxID=133901 RepID=A0A9C6XVG6_FRAOC
MFVISVGSATPDPSSAGQSEIVAVISGGSIPSVNVDTTPMCQLVLASPTPNQSGSSNSFGSIEKKTLKESGSAENHKVLKSKKKKSMRIKKRKFTTALNVMQEHSFKLDQVQGMLRRILGKMFPEEVVRKPAGMPNIPLKDHDEFQQMEEYLRDDENFDALVNHLFGNVKYADNERNCVYISLDKLFTPELCATISWKGTKGEKYPFFNTKCLELLQ